MLIRTLTLIFTLALASQFAPAATTFPILTYSTYLRDSFTPKAVATDAAGNIYLAGNAVVDPSTSQMGALVVKLDPTASQYLYVRFINGSVAEAANAIAVDSAGNAYVVGSTASPDFPVTSSGKLASAPGGTSNQRSFVTKLDANGGIVFSDILGGTAVSAASAVAVNASGQIIVTGASTSAGFPATTGALSVTNTSNHPYLLALDPAGAKTVFSATGVGGTALAIGPSGDIFVAGTTALLDYPLTSGVYQPALPVFQVCIAPCHATFQGLNQYISRIDAAGTKLVYSTSLSGTGNTSNAGLAVDAAGNAYVTGYAGMAYPYTVPVSLTSPILVFNFPALPFLTKIDPLGQKLLYSVPVGGTGVQIDASGAAYVAGGVGGSQLGRYLVGNVPGLAGVAAACLPNNLTIRDSAYAAQVDASGNLTGTQYIGGSELSITGAALSSSGLWLAGATPLPDFPITPNAITPSSYPAFPVAGAFLGAIDFSQPQAPAGTPQIGCILDAATLAPAGPVVPYQLLTIFGSNLGPASGVVASDNTTKLLGGVNIPFNNGPASDTASLLYASANQVNFAVPHANPGATATSMQLSVNGVASPSRGLRLTFANPSLFMDLAASTNTNSAFAFIAFAMNADGTINSATNPASLGSTLSVFLNGVSPDPAIISATPQLLTLDGWSVTGFSQASPFVTRVDLRTPSALVNNFACPSATGVCTAGFTLFDVFGFSRGTAVNVQGQAVGAAVFLRR